MVTTALVKRSCLGGRWVGALFSAAIFLPLLSSSTLHAEEEADAVRPERGERAASQGDRSERRAEMRKKMLKKFDADGDGKLNDEERAELRKERKEMGERRGSGIRGGGERGNREGKRGHPGKGARERGSESRRQGFHDRGFRDQGGPPDLDKLFEKFDRDGDERLDRKEFKAALHVLREMHQRRMGRLGEGRRGGPGPGKDRDGDGFRRRPRPDREGRRPGPPPERRPRSDRD